ncbi:MAG: enoyl-CoA hydratase/isomerase family protein [Deltaproteobacteria bacterium]|nr:enoyl-CoA hydratase/isomerase family protein [Deltaproteobacteria bacterium]
MADAFKNILFAVHDAIATVTINRPEKLNTLSVETLYELRQAVESILEQEEIRVAVITGAGEKAFVAGADVSELARLNPPEAKSFSLLGQGIFNMIENGGKPFIAAVNGFALGGGCELALACSIRIASENARLGQPEVKLGIITGFGGSQRLLRVAGKARALELCLFGEPIDAKTACEWGLVNKVVAQSRLMDEACSLAQKLASFSPLALKYTLEAVNTDAPLEQGLSREANLFALCFATEDMKEGTSAFLQKRKAQFKGK